MLSPAVIAFLTDILESAALNVPVANIEEVATLVAQTRTELAQELARTQEAPE